jgi:Skp family chaperone for outer membrane proteins
MKSLTRTALGAAIALSLSLPMAATPAAAQVAGIATANPTAVIVRSKARDAAYAQIEQTYASNIASIRTLNQEIAGLEAQLDTNGDKQVSQTEAQANPSVLTQIQQKEQQYEQLVQPMALAQYYVIEQLIGDYANARQQVVNDRKIQLLLDPSAVQWGPDSVDVTSNIVAALDQRMPSVQAAPPANWRPRQETVQTHQAVQQVLVMSAQAAMLRQQQAQAQGQAGASTPAQPTTSGR